MQPSPIPVAALPPLYSAVGELVVNWAFAEQALVGIIAVIYQAAGGKHEDAVIPVAFGRRRKFLRRCFARIPALAPFAAEGQQILVEAKALEAIRNAIIHGALSGYDATTGGYTFTKLDTDDRERIHIANSLTTTPADLRGATIDCQQLARRAGALADRLMDQFVRQQ